MKTTVAALAAMLFCAGAQAGVTQEQIDYWTLQYTGAELPQSLAQCGDPKIPDATFATRESSAVVERFTRWSACYQAAVDRLTLQGAPINNVPADVRFAMTVEQYRTAARRADVAYARAVDHIAAEAAPVIARFDAWAGRTAAWQRRAGWSSGITQMAASYSGGGANYNIVRAIR
ncbi:hypothetical protein E4L96_00755 [Massilia arenosa]|uniref:DUF1311 domain-containing protein n=1 Tax=Zemynaea arenosa TaxID=2561931 RepID=A0A4Y9STT3_9BURK|nr:hypothetical protein [Massilia arenosa]TFW30021.1 hypothetical protein E4L96_00755 [Massilia arenosa]